MLTLCSDLFNKLRDETTSVDTSSAIFDDGKKFQFQLNFLPLPSSLSVSNLRCMSAFHLLLSVSSFLSCVGLMFHCGFCWFCLVCFLCTCSVCSAFDSALLACRLFSGMNLFVVTMYWSFIVGLQFNSICLPFILLQVITLGFWVCLYIICLWFHSCHNTIPVFFIIIITPILNYNLSGYRIISNLNVAKWNVDASSMKEASLSIQ